MLGLSLWQPRASLVALGAKRIETRGRRTKYRGPLAIQAAKEIPEESVAFFERSEQARRALLPLGVRTSEDLFHLPRGVIVATCELVECLSTNPTLLAGPYSMPDTDSAEYEFGIYTPNRFMFFLENIQRLERPVPCKGLPGLFPLDEDLITELAHKQPEVD